MMVHKVERAGAHVFTQDGIKTFPLLRKAASNKASWIPYG